MKAAIASILEYTRGIDYSEFLADNKTKDAVVRNLQVLGESSKGVSEGFRRKHPQVPWKNLAMVRDRLVHHYFGVNYEIVWEITRERLPKVLLELEKF
ncbi:DUF86 domain-containing protein [Candidatus Micrarchaeota archaeon]|nr:DUF86 domain-containing protein [Candidatus Micrarchaeota archaeon]MBI5176965.1 DUF86 domain-containing protein [Candidatus Micrarchaeota archaeon]